MFFSRVSLAAFLSDALLRTSAYDFYSLFIHLRMRGQPINVDHRQSSVFSQDRLR